MRLSVLAVLSVLATGCFDVDRVTGGPPLGYETDPIKCSNGYDDDNDGLVDCLDPDCIRRNFCGEIVPLLPPSGNETTLQECTDGVDNDLDGQFDCGDRGCQAIRELCCVSEFDDALQDQAVREIDDERTRDVLVREFESSLGELEVEGRLVMRLRYGLHDDEPWSLEQIADRMRLTVDGVRRIETRAVQTLRRLQHLRGCLN